MVACPRGCGGIWWGKEYYRFVVPVSMAAGQVSISSIECWNLLVGPPVERMGGVGFPRTTLPRWGRTTLPRWGRCVTRTNLASSPLCGKLMSHHGLVLTCAQCSWEGIYTRSWAGKCTLSCWLEPCIDITCSSFEFAHAPTPLYKLLLWCILTNCVHPFCNLSIYIECIVYTCLLCMVFWTDRL